MIIRLKNRIFVTVREGQTDMAVKREKTWGYFLIILYRHEDIIRKRKLIQVSLIYYTRTTNILLYVYCTNERQRRQRL